MAKSLEVKIDEDFSSPNGSKNTIGFPVTAKRGQQTFTEYRQQHVNLLFIFT